MNIRKSAFIISISALFAAAVFGCAGSDSKNMTAALPSTQNAAETRIAESNEEAGKEEATSASAAEADKTEKKEDDSRVIILYTNDTHTYINNVIKDKDGKESPGLTFASVAALKKELESEGENVILVDDGDLVQGTAYGSMDEGRSVLKIMNAVGYQAASVGNHEFDYGQFRFFQILDEAAFPFLSCNFYNTGDGSPVLPAYKVIESGGVRVAFVGISTPETITKAAPVYFMDESQQNFIYGFYSGDNGEELYSKVQEAVDEASKEADYVIALGHLGDHPESAPYRSIDVIEHTTGIDAFIDGHSHSVVEYSEVENADGRKIPLTQTGSYLNAIGKMTVEGDKISTELIREYSGKDEAIAEMTDQWASEVDRKLGEVIAVNDDVLYIYDPDDPEKRIVRNHETNLGDLVADSFYYYINEKAGLDCDAVIQNSGGVRAQIDQGDFSYKTAKLVAPFGNVTCLVKMTGSQLKEALEDGASKIGGIDSKTGKDYEDGGFMQVAGMRYSVDTGIESTVSIDNNGMWLAPPTGDYKVHDIEIYNRESGQYEPLDPEKSYSIGGINYLLRNQGEGLTMLKDTELVQDYMQEDYLVISEYVKNFEKAADGQSHICSEASPLKKYSGYQIDYENPYGAGRITLENQTK